MPRGRIDDEVLFDMLTRQRRTQREAAEHFGVSEAAVSKRLKVLNHNLPRHVGLERAAAVADRGLNVIDQLEEVNRIVREELDRVRSEALKPGPPRKDLQELVLDHVAEVRKQLGLQLEIFRALYDVQEVARFQQEVLDAIASVAPETRQAIIERLSQRRALRAALVVASAGA